jgi:hypothetical protein
MIIPYSAPFIYYQALEFGLRRAFKPIFDKIKNAKELYEEDIATLRYSY